MRLADNLDGSAAAGRSGSEKRATMGGGSGGRGLAGTRLPTTFPPSLAAFTKAEGPLGWLLDGIGAMLQTTSGSARQIAAILHYLCRSTAQVYT